MSASDSAITSFEAASPDLAVRELTTDADLRSVFPVVHALRHRLTAETFLSLVRQQQAEGYILVGGFASNRLVVVAGYRASCTLSRGPHLFVDDLVTATADQGKGYGAAMIHWLRRKARELNLPAVYLDSRDKAVGFYEQLGFTFMTSKPCWIDVADDVAQTDS